MRKKETTRQVDTRLVAIYLLVLTAVKRHWGFFTAVGKVLTIFRFDLDRWDFWEESPNEWEECPDEWEESPNENPIPWYTKKSQWDLQLRKYYSCINTGGS